MMKNVTEIVRGGTQNSAIEAIWEETRTLCEIVDRDRKLGDSLGYLPDSIVQAFIDRDVYRLILPEDLGGRGIDPSTQFDIIEEVAFHDGSTGWNYAIASTSGVIGGVFEPDVTREIFKDRDQGLCVSGAVQGKAVAVDGGYRVSGKFAWASGIYQSTWCAGGCFVYDGDERRVGPNGAPMVIHPLMAVKDVKILDAWHVSGMRATGSTEFLVEGLFVPEDRTFTLYATPPKHPSPLFKIPSTFFGWGICAVTLGVARSAVEGLKDLAHRKKAPPPRLGLDEQQFTQYAVAKSEAMIEASYTNVKAAFWNVWEQICEKGESTLEARARMRRAMVHAAESSVEAVQLVCRAAGGNALFETEPFERALRDVTAGASHLVFQRVMMEDCGRVALGKTPLLAIF